MELDPNFAEGHLFLGESYEQLGKALAGIEELEKAATLSGERTWMLGALGHAYATSGQRAKAEKEVGFLLGRSYVSKYDVAVICAPPQRSAPSHRVAGALGSFAGCEPF